ncbi:NifB/NifX family molybdenum-iron cluster-binding protein [candidate division KSB1 bacterium]
MKIAVPIYENRISPRFDCANKFLVVSVDNGEIVDKDNLVLSSINPIHRVNELVNFNIDTLICGAINEFTYGMISSKGIDVIPWVTGDVAEVLDLFLNGELMPGMTFFPDGRRICRKVRFGRGRGRGVPRWI